MNNDLKALAGVLSGVAVGTVVGLLIAPDSGKETRKKLDFEATKFNDNLSKAMRNSFEALQDSLTNTGDDISSKVNKTETRNKEDMKRELTGRFSKEELKRKAGEA